MRHIYKYLLLLSLVSAFFLGQANATVWGPNWSYTGADVTGTITDNSVVRGDAQGVQDSGVIIDDSDNVTGIADLTVTGNVTANSFSTTENYYGEMYFYESAGTETVDQTGQYYAVAGQFITGLVDNWTFVTGSSGGGTITTAAAGAAINISDVAHGLVSGDYVNVQSANHSGTSVVTYVDADNFTVAIAYVGDEAGTWQEGDYLLAATGSAGVYQLSIAVTASAGAAAKQYKFEAVQNATHLDKTAFEIMTSATDHQSSAGQGFITVVVGDRIWLQFKNETDTQNLNYEHANVSVNKIH